MTISRRKLLQSGALVGAAAGLVPSLAHTSDADAAQRGGQQSGGAPLPAAFDSLKPLGDRVKPITVEEFQARVARAQKLMTDAKPDFAALYLAPGTSLYYFTGIHWGQSERVAGAVIPRSGAPLLFCPGFEESRYRELMRWPTEVRVWQEDQNPGELVAKWLGEKGIRSGRIAIDETTRFAYFDKLKKAAPQFEYVLGDPITAGCRARKSEHELELMRLACSATMRCISRGVRNSNRRHDAIRRREFIFTRTAEDGIARRRRAGAGRKMGGATAWNYNSAETAGRTSVVDRRGNNCGRIRIGRDALHGDRENSGENSARV